MGLFKRKKKQQVDSNTEWTSFEFVQHLIKYPDESDEKIVSMYDNLLGEDNLEIDMENYWRQILSDSFISQEEFKKIRKDFNQRFKKIRKMSQAKNEADDIAKWALTNTNDDRTIDKKSLKKDGKVNSNTKV